MICIWSSWCHCHPIISCSIKIQNGLPFWCRLTQVVLEKRLLNGCSSSSSSSHRLAFHYFHKLVMSLYVNWLKLVPTSQSRHKESSAPSIWIKSPVVDEDRMRPGHFSALTLLVGWQEGHLACKETRATYPQRFCSRSGGGRKPRGTGWTRFTWKVAIKKEVGW